MADSWNTPISQGSGNIIFHNNLFNNSENANVDYQYPNKVKGIINGTAIVSWDNGTVGNYWSDYNGNGSYVIDENNVDHYPLTQPVDISTVNPTPIDSSDRQILLSAIPIIAVAVLAVIIISALLLRRHRKPASLGN